MGVVRLINNFPDRSIRHSVCSIGPDLSMKEHLPETTACHSLNIRKASRTAFAKLASLFAGTCVDIVHVNNMAPWFDAALASKLAGCRCIETFHGIEEGTLKLSTLKKLQLFWAWKLSDGITAVSPAALTLFSSLTGINERHVHVIRNGIDTDLFRPARCDQKTELRQSLGLSPAQTVLGCVSALRKVKNHAGLLKAFAAALLDYPEMMLVLVGDGPERTDLEALCRQQNIRNKVVFAGARKQVIHYLNVFDFFVLNSRTEGLSYALLEAMSAGLPVIVTKVGGNIQLIEDGTDGLLVAENDQKALKTGILRLCKNIELRTRMGGNARKKVVEKYSQGQMLKKYRQLYMSLYCKNGYQLFRKG